MARKKKRLGRPPRPMPEPIPDTATNIARAIMQGPPKKDWDYLKEAKREGQSGDTRGAGD